MVCFRADEHAGCEVDGPVLLMQSMAAQVFPQMDRPVLVLVVPALAVFGRNSFFPCGGEVANAK